MAFFVNRQMGKGMNSGSEDSASGQAGLLGIGRDMLGTGRDMLGIGRDMLGIYRDMLGIYRNKFRCRTCRIIPIEAGSTYIYGDNGIGGNLKTAIRSLQSSSPTRSRRYHPHWANP